MWGYRWFSKTRKYRSSRTSTLDGCTIAGVERFEHHTTGLDLFTDVLIAEQHTGNLSALRLEWSPWRQTRSARCSYILVFAA